MRGHAYKDTGPHQIHELPTLISQEIEKEEIITKQVKKKHTEI